MLVPMTSNRPLGWAAEFRTFAVRGGVVNVAAGIQDLLAQSRA